MGLDMYLEARKYVAKMDWAANRDGAYEDTPLTAGYKAVQALLPEGIDEFGSVSGANIQITVGYWRKANAIHNWFVNECGGGVDECQPIRVDNSNLLALRAYVEEVLEKPEMASKHLPTASGFFFGSTDYDEWYVKDLEHTLKIIDKALSLPEDEFDFIYQASG